MREVWERGVLACSRVMSAVLAHPWPCRLKEAVHAILHLQESERSGLPLCSLVGFLTACLLMSPSFPLLPPPGDGKGTRRASWWCYNPLVGQQEVKGHLGVHGIGRGGCNGCSRSECIKISLGHLGPSHKHLVSHTHRAGQVKAKVDAEERVIDSFETAICLESTQRLHAGILLACCSAYCGEDAS